MNIRMDKLMKIRTDTDLEKRTTKGGRQYERGTEPQNKITS